MRRIAAEDFVAALHKAGMGPTAPVTVAGQAVLDGLSFDKPLSLSQVTFEDDLSLAGADFAAGLSFDKCTFQGSVNLGATRVDADLDITDCTFIRGAFPTRRILYMNSIDVRGNLAIHNVKGCRGVSIGHADIRGTLRISDVEIRDHDLNSSYYKGQKEALDLTNSTIGGDLIIGQPPPESSASEAFAGGDKKDSFVRLSGPMRLTDTKVTGAVVMENTVLAPPKVLDWISGKEEKPKPLDPYREWPGGVDLEAAGLDCMSLFLMNCSILGKCTLVGVKVHNLLRISHGRREPESNVAHLPDVLGETDISSATIGSQLDLQSVWLSGALRLIGAKCGSFLAVGFAGQECFFGAVSLIDSTFVSYARFLSCRIGTNPNRLRAVQRGTERVFLGFAADTCTFGSGLAFWRHANTSRRFEDWKTGAALMNHTGWKTDCGFTMVGGQFLLVNCRLEDDLDLTRLCVMPHQTQTVGKDEQLPIEETKLYKAVIEFVGGLPESERQRILKTPYPLRQAYLDFLDTNPDPELLVPDEGLSAHGGIVLDKTEIRGSVRFRSPQSTAVDPGEVRDLRDLAKDWLRWDAKEYSEQPTPPPPEEMPSPKAAEAEDVPASKTPPTFEETRARAQFLQMRRTRIVGDADLTGLTIEQDPAASSLSTSRSGHIQAERLCVMGEMRTLARFDPIDPGDPPPSEAHLVVPGALRLNDADIAELTVSRHSFPLGEVTDPMPAAAAAGIVLEEARIGHLKIPRDDTCADCTRGFPLPVDLSGLKVQSWSFGTDQPPGYRGERWLADAHLDILANDESLNRDIYQDVFRQLKNNGHERAAKWVYKAEHDRAFEEAHESQFSVRSYLSEKLDRFVPRPGRLYRPWTLPFLMLLDLLVAGGAGLDRLRSLGSRSWHRTKRLLLNHGLSPAPLGWVILGLFVFSWLAVGDDRRNFALSTEARLLLTEAHALGTPDFAAGLEYDESTDETLRPAEVDWNWGTGLWLTMRSHVPLVGLLARTEIEPSGDTRLYLFGREARIGGEPPPEAVESLPFTPEDWFTIMAILNWLLWPVFLTFLLKRTFRSDL